MNLYWGDLHNHCGITYGFGSLQNALKAARGQLDFCSVTPHAMWLDPPARSPETEYLLSYHENGFAKIRRSWDDVRAEMEAANQDGEFITFHSFEMHSSRFGDYHFVSPDARLRIIEGESPRDIVQRECCPVIAVPHHIAYTPGYRGIIWDRFDPEISPIVEVCSKHGCSMSDKARFPYYHTMGPRDTRGTVYEGMRKGYRFGFVGSTDHHAGYPGSYGDGKLAVLAPRKTREDIWQALLQGRTYAVTGDRIQCELTLNGVPMGGSAAPAGQAELLYDVRAWDFIDKLVIMRNQRPIHVLCGESLSPASEEKRYRLRVELGWGNDAGEPYRWECGVQVSGGRVTDAQPCFRGRSVLAPKPGMNDDDNINDLDNALSFDENGASLRCFTVCNQSTLHPSTSGASLEVDGSPRTALRFTINGRVIETTVEELLEQNITGQEKPYASEGFKIHLAVPESAYHARGALPVRELRPGDCFHMEVTQANGHCAFVSPICVR